MPSCRAWKLGRRDMQQGKVSARNPPAGWLELVAGRQDPRCLWAIALLGGLQYCAASPFDYARRRRYSGTHRYTAAILAYVFGVGSFMAVASPNFGGLFKKQQALEGAHRQLQVGSCCRCCIQGPERQEQGGTGGRVGHEREM